MTTPPRGFLSDNASGVHPAVLAAITEANEGHTPSYGTDPWTAQLGEVVADAFGPDTQVFPVFNGTGANVVAMQALLQRWEAVVAPRTAHVVTDESTAPQLVGGTATRTVPGAQGKLTPAAVEPVLSAYDGSVHHARPAALSLTQSTELGTTYSGPELAALAALAHAHDVRVHIDGARLANAAARLGCTLGEAATGAHVISFGGTKNGLLLGEAVVVRDQRLAHAVAHLRKASAQLASKMRFVSAQLLALLREDLWRRNAQHANDAADHLAARAREELSLEPVYPVQANAVFLPVPPERLMTVVGQAPVLAWDAGSVRAVASFDTTEDDVEQLIDAMRRALG